MNEMRMLEGKVIKFHRELQKLKQKELAEGVCSTTHISKIERGQTEVSTEIIDILTERLGIDMNSELETYFLLESLLDKWHESIILKLDSKAENLKKELEGNLFLQLPDFYCTYTLILTRYYLATGEKNRAKSLIEKMDRWTDLSPYSKNMLLHIKGINFYYKDEYFKAISLLKEIDPHYYNNPEYHYDLALAYHSVNSRVLSYYHANKALHFFTVARCYSRVIDTELLMLIQVEQDDFYDPKDSEYQKLIEMAENYGLERQRSQLIHNYAYHQLRHGHYDEACQLYKQAMNTQNPRTPNYLGSLEGYLNALTKQGTTSNEDLLQLAENGLSHAKKIQSTTFIHFFQLHKYRLQGKRDQYFHYLETEAYPHLKEAGYVLPAEHYEMKLFRYYREKDEMEKANQFAWSIVARLHKEDKFV